MATVEEYIWGNVYILLWYLIHKLVKSKNQNGEVAKQVIIRLQWVENEVLKMVFAHFLIKKSVTLSKQ